MTTRTYRTNLRCAGCLDAIRPHLDALPGIKRWSADVAVTDKPITIEGDVAPDAVEAAMKKAGYAVLGEAHVQPPAEPKPTYYPLALIVAYLLGIALLFEVASTSFDWMRLMRHFMAEFFFVFSFFKLLDVSAFASAYTAYDIVAKRWITYGYVYPFLELLLGVAYLTSWQPVATNIATIILMALGTVGVSQTLLAKRQVRCACLGGIINLPVATVTLIEDAGMGLMALAMLFWPH